MKLKLLLLFLSMYIGIQAQHILQRENGVIFNGVEIISPPNLTDGFGSAAGGIYGDSLSYFYEEQNDSYNGVDLVGSSWMSYGDLLPKVLPGVVTIGLGFTPDTFRWEFTADSIFVSVKDAETSGFSNYQFEYQKFIGPTNGIDSLHIYDSILIEPSLVKVYDNISAVPIRERYSNYNIDVFPNPCIDQLKIRLPNNSFIKQLALIDLEGRLVNQFDSNFSNRGVIELNSINTGLYLLSIETKDGKLFYEKILVK